MVPFDLSLPVAHLPHSLTPSPLYKLTISLHSYAAISSSKFLGRKTRYSNANRERANAKYTRFGARHYACILISSRNLYFFPAAPHPFTSPAIFQLCTGRGLGWGGVEGEGAVFIRQSFSRFSLENSLYALSAKQPFDTRVFSYVPIAKRESKGRGCSL